MNSSVPITAEAIIPVGTSDVQGIPSIALTIPDFEGYAILRFFSNATRTEIGCFQAVMRNGVTFAQAGSVVPVLGIFTVVAMLSSAATAIYGVSITAMRTHYAHSISVLVVFEVFQSIFFSGALSLNWPSVCAAWWSNFAWSAGIIPTSGVTNSINDFIGANLGNNSQVGGAGSTTINNNGGLSSQIYGRSLNLMSKDLYRSVRRGRQLANRLYERGVSSNDTGGSGYTWAGNPVPGGLPLPGNWSGFAGELSEISFPVSDAFLTGLIWFLILIAIIIGLTVAFKWILEGLNFMKMIKPDRLALFRSHWLGFLGLIVLRSMFIAFFMIMTLTLYQFTLGAGAGVTVIAVLVFLVFLVGMFGIAGYACFYRLRFGHYKTSPDRIHIQHQKVMKVIPWLGAVRQSTLEKEMGNTARKFVGSIPFFRIWYVNQDPGRQSIHQDEGYNKRFGWLSARYRRTRWWFFAVWAVYQFVRACFVGGASNHPSLQVFGLFCVEIVALIVILWFCPFEGARNTALAVYMLGFSKVATAGLSVAFLPQWNLARIPITVIGIVIIIIQGLLTIALIILIVLGAISTYLSLYRNREDIKPEALEGIRLKYYNHLEQKATDLPPPRPPPSPPSPKEPKEPYFNVNTVRRAPKIEDEDCDFVPDLENPSTSHLSLAGRSQSRANSVHSHYSGYGNVPFGARVHRASWSSREFTKFQEDGLNDSPSRAQSRQTSGNWANHAAEISMSTMPLVRPQSAAGSIRSSTPTTEHQRRYASQRFGAVK